MCHMRASGPVVLVLVVALWGVGCGRDRVTDVEGQAGAGSMTQGGALEGAGGGGAAPDGAVSGEAAREGRAMAGEGAVEARRVLALGDSYTIGEGVDADARWPSRLVEALRGEGLTIASPEVVARTGWTTDELAVAITRRDLRGPYDLVTLLIGVNDQYRGGTVEAYAPAFGGLLETAVGFAGGEAGRVVVVSIPDWGASPFARRQDTQAIGAAINAFNAEARRQTRARGAAWVDITPRSRQLGGQSEMFAPDGLHPSGAQHEAWMLRILPAARAALAR